MAKNRKIDNNLGIIQIQKDGKEKILKQKKIW